MPLTVTIKPAGLSVTCKKGTSLAEVAREAGIPLLSSCGGNGICGRCRVRILSGSIHLPSAEEIKHIPDADLSDGYRLACQVRIAGDTTVDIPSLSLFFQPTIPLQGMKIELPPIEASVHDYIVETAGANPHDAQALWKSLATELRQRHDQDAIAIDATVLASLPDAFRAGAERLRISIRTREAISIRQADSTPYGLAVDLGTTTIAGYLVDLANGTLLSARAIMNPQHAFGEDVMSRIACVLETGDRELRRAAADGINALITALCGEPGSRARGTDRRGVVADGCSATHRGDRRRPGGHGVRTTRGGARASGHVARARGSTGRNRVVLAAHHTGQPSARRVAAP